MRRAATIAVLSLLLIGTGTPAVAASFTFLSNQGRVGNAGFVVGRIGVLAIDTGTSYRHGRALLDAIRSVTDKPVRLAIITHTRQEFLFGAAAFRELGIPIAMHQAAADLMASRCDACLKTLRTTLGEEEMRGTTLFEPDIRFTDPLGVNAATLIGRPIQVLYFGHSSGPGDIAVLDPRSGALFAGGLLDAQRIPDVLDSDLSTSRGRSPIATGTPRGPVYGPGSGARSGMGRAITKLDNAISRKGHNRTRKRLANPPNGRGQSISCVLRMTSKPARSSKA